MKRIVLILISVVLLVSCAEKPKNYTVILHGNRGFDDEKVVISALTDSIAYKDALIKFYGAKIASKQYKFKDKYAYISVLNEAGQSLFPILGSNTIDNIKIDLSTHPIIKEIQEEDSKLPEF
ncbi:hypothetical protein [Sphingobacterium cavernae]|uniref:hypothetical protein n=1 Tax=Sphingobacterium cavernae TaxID=2592657 RepID=UPI00122FB4B7|nr:hypothetical protein [Sphingobacterium cavernae]